MYFDIVYNSWAVFQDEIYDVNKDGFFLLVGVKGKCWRDADCGYVL